MSYDVPKKLDGFEPYEPIAGEYRIRLDANESFIKLEKSVVEKAASQLESNRYPDPFAQRVREKFADYYGIKPEHLTAGNGSDEILSIISTALLEKGSKVIFIAPDFGMFKIYSMLAEHEIIELGKNADLTIDVDGLINAVRRENADCIYFSNPCNPTSVLLSDDEVRRLVTSVSCLVILDEAYMDFCGEGLTKEAHLYDNLIVLRTCSKAMGMAALRLGFAVANPRITRLLQAVKSPYNVNSLTQLVAEEVLADKEKLAADRNVIIAETKWLYERILRLSLFEKVYPTSTNFVFVKTEQADEIFEFLLRKSICIRKFNGYLRMTAGNRNENTALLQALSEYRGG